MRGRRMWRAVHSAKASSSVYRLTIQLRIMAPDPRLSDKELAAINAAAVTQEYRVQPHLGRC